MRQAALKGVFLLILLAVVSISSGAEEVQTSDLAKGMWVILLMPDDEPISDEAIAPLQSCEDVFPEFKYVVSLHHTETDTALELPDGVSLHIDAAREFRTRFQIADQPTVIVMAQELILKRLPWPLSLGGILRMVAEAAYIAPSVPERANLEGRPVPDFGAVNQAGESVDIHEIELPVLIAFEANSCSSCYDAFTPLVCSLEGIGNVIIARAAPIDGDLPQSLDWGFCSDSAIWFVDVVEFLFAFSIRSSPGYILIDAAGIIRNVHEGATTEEEIRSWVEW